MTPNLRQRRQTLMLLLLQVAAVWEGTAELPMMVVVGFVTMMMMMMMRVRCRCL